MVELALVLPVLMALVLGMLSLGLALNNDQQVNHAVREGARFGAAVPADQDFSSGSWASNVRDLIKDRSAGTLTATGTTLCVALVEGSSGSSAYPLKVVTTSGQSASWFSTSGSPCMASETYPVTADDNGRRVQVRATRQDELETLAWTWPITLEGEATAKAEASS